MAMMYRIMKMTKGYGTSVVNDGYPIRAIADLDAIALRQKNVVCFVQEYEEARTKEQYALTGKPKK